MLTIFSTCKPAKKGLFRIIQDNAVGSWRRISDDVILFGDRAHEEHLQKLADRHGCRLVGGVERNRWGTPLMGSLFAQARRHARTSVLAFVNSDIILLSDFLDAIERLNEGFDRWVMVGRKRHMPPPPPIDFSTDWETRIRALAKHTGKLWYPTGTDYAAFPKGAFRDIEWPPFAVGRWRWDTWMMGRMHAQSGCPVVDATDVVLAVHPEHPQADRNTPEEKFLEKLSSKFPRIRIRLLRWKLTERGVVKNG